MSRVLPILFNTEMVRAILDGRKTVTRRLIKPQPIKGHYTFVYYSGNNHIKTETGIIKPPYKPGDILYVRETVWQKVGHYLDVDGETKPSWYKEFKYAATDEKPETGWNYSWSKRPSIHMPKEAARIWLKVKDVRVERLQDMDEDDAFAEGISPWNDKCYAKNGWKPTFYDPDSGGACCPLDAFEDIWNSTIKKSDLDRYGWDENPWVWVIEFERCDKPENI